MTKRIGDKFERLTIVGFSHYGPNGENHRMAYWLCRCDCGNYTTVANRNLGQSTKSCSCLKNEQSSKRMYRHGMSHTPTHRSWAMMWDRCTNKTREKYKIYGGGGVNVCDRWKVFENFLEDMGKRPKNKTLDRIDPFGNYTPENCKWSTHQEQIRNRRNIGKGYNWRDKQGGYYEIRVCKDNKVYSFGIAKDEETAKRKVQRARKELGLREEKDE